jgi:hypothetical protein
MEKPLLQNAEEAKIEGLIPSKLTPSLKLAYKEKKRPEEDRSSRIRGSSMNASARQVA